LRISSRGSLTSPPPFPRWCGLIGNSVRCLNTMEEFWLQVGSGMFNAQPLIRLGLCSGIPAELVPTVASSLERELVSGSIWFPADIWQEIVFPRAHSPVDRAQHRLLATGRAVRGRAPDSPATQARQARQHCSGRWGSWNQLPNVQRVWTSSRTIRITDSALHADLREYQRNAPPL